MKNFSSFSEDSQLKLIILLFSDSFDIASNDRHKMIFKSIDIKNLISLIKENDDWMEFIITSFDHYVKILHPEELYTPVEATITNDLYRKVSIENQGGFFRNSLHASDKIAKILYTVMIKNI